MRANAGILILIGLLLVVCTVSAADPYTITLSNSPDWIVANGVNQATITATVWNSSVLVEGATVKFSVDDAVYGTMSPSTNTTSASGRAQGFLKVGTRSGTAVITATMTYVDAYGVTYTANSTISQDIDHDSPYVPRYVYPASGTVGTEVPMLITFKDRWGNVIDSRNPAETHTISLHVHGPHPDDCGFVDGASYPHDISKTLDAYGNVSVIIKLTTRSGYNNILLDRFGSIPDGSKSIQAVSNAVPVRMEAFIDPSGHPPTVIADGTSEFTIQYIFYDHYNNPTVGQPINFTTTEPGYYEDQYTMRDGDVWYYFGPKSFTGSYDLTATAVNNKSVTNTMLVRFYNSSPTNLMITANPASMPSRDANAAIYSTIRAKVVDVMGNPVDGESVTFTLHNVEFDPDWVGHADEPSFAPSSEVVTVTETTNAGGIAEVKFYPTTFSVFGEPNYDPTATGTCKITAEWKGIQRDTDLTWKNYPYLSAVMEITPSQVTVGDTIDVNLKLNGDGWALHPNPVDAVLVIDKSGSMNTAMGGQTRLYWAKVAATNFVDNMSYGDQVGLVKYGDTATLVDSLSTDLLTVKTDIASISQGGYTSTRQALLYAIEDIISNRNTNPKSIQAVVLMSDGEFNYFGDPLGRGTGYPISDGYGWTSTYTSRHTYFSGLPAPAGTVYVSGADVGTNQDMSLYAANNNIRIYTIFFNPVETPSGTTWDTMGTLATTTGGKRYHAKTGSELDDVYHEIAGDLKEAAGVGTVAYLDFGSIYVNDQLDTSGSFFDYVSDPGTASDGVTNTTSPTTAPGSTMIDKYNTDTGEHFVPGSGYTLVGPMYHNMTGYWNSHTPHQLYFDIGTVRLHETWETSFRLRVLKEGSFSLMGPNSLVTFFDEDGTSSEMKLANRSGGYSAGDTVFKGATWKKITITDFRRTDTATGEGNLTQTVPITWTTSYTGMFPVTHDVYYIHGSDPEIRFDQKLTTGTGSKTLYSQLDMSRLPPGNYWIKVHAYASDANADATIGPWPYDTQTRAFIVLE